MYLIDTNIISEIRKKARGHPGVTRLFNDFQSMGSTIYLSSITIGELQRGISLCRHRGDTQRNIGDGEIIF